MAAKRWAWDGETAGFIGSVLGAIALLVLVRLFSGR